MKGIGLMIVIKEKAPLYMQISKKILVFIRIWNLEVHLPESPGESNKKKYGATVIRRDN